jgi:hypothetical protein
MAHVEQKDPVAQSSTSGFVDGQYLATDDIFIFTLYLFMEVVEGPQGGEARKGTSRVSRGFLRIAATLAREGEGLGPIF